MNFDKEIRARLAAPYPPAPYLMAGEEETTERGILSRAVQFSREMIRYS